jgi:hypothetical protein
MAPCHRNASSRLRLKDPGGGPPWAKTPHPIGGHLQEADTLVLSLSKCEPPDPFPNSISEITHCHMYCLQWETWQGPRYRPLRD